MSTVKDSVVMFERCGKERRSLGLLSVARSAHSGSISTASPRSIVWTTSTVSIQTHFLWWRPRNWSREKDGECAEVRVLPICRRSIWTWNGNKCSSSLSAVFVPRSVLELFSLGLKTQRWLTFSVCEFSKLKFVRFVVIFRSVKLSYRCGIGSLTDFSFGHASVIWGFNSVFLSPKELSLPRWIDALCQSWYADRITFDFSFSEFPNYMLSNPPITSLIDDYQGKTTVA